MENKDIIEFRKQLGLSQEKFAKKLGVSQSTIGYIESGKRNVPKSVIEALIKNFGFENKEEENIKQTVLNRNIVSIPFYNIGAAAGAGTYLDGEEKEETPMFFDERWLKNILGVNPDNLHLIYAVGDSMDSGKNQPDDIKDRDLLLVDTSRKTGNNKIFVILVNKAELRVKKLFYNTNGVLKIISNNPDYKEEVYYPNKSDVEIEVIGRVIWNGSKEYL